MQKIQMQLHAWFKQPKFRLFSLMAVGIAIFLAIVAALIYMMWQNSPEKALLDAVDYARKSPAAYKVTAPDGSQMDITTDGVRIRMDGRYDGANISTIVDGLNVYLKTDSPEVLIKAVDDQENSLGNSPLVQRWFTTLDEYTSDKWMMVSVENFPRSTLGVAMLQCSLALRTGLSDADDSIPQLRDTYALNQFISTKSSASDQGGSTHTYAVDSQKMQTFFGKLLQTPLGRQIGNCGYVPEMLEDQTPKDLTFTVSVSQPEHRFRSITINADGKELTKITVENKPQETIELPTEVFDFGRVLNALNLIQSTQKSQNQ